MSTAGIVRHDLAQRSEIARRLDRLGITTVQRLDAGGVTTLEQLRTLLEREALLRRHPFFLDATELAAIRFALGQLPEGR